MGALRAVFARRDVLTVAGVAVVAFSIRLVPVLTSGGLFGAPNYDPAVYYAAAVGLFEGRLPYRDFLLLHPPGMLLLLQPFAALGHWVGDPTAFAVARVTFMAGGTISAALVFVLLRAHGPVAAWAGAGLYAIYPAAAHVERATWLEAPATLLLLLALVALRPSGASVRQWRSAVAGALLALAALTKLWGVVLLVVVLVWTLLGRGVRAALVALLGSAVASVVTLAPFWSVLPQLRSDVVNAQLGRPSVRADPGLRAGMLLGLDQPTAARAAAVVVIGLALVVLAIAVLAVGRPGGRLYLALLVGAVGTLFAVPAWYPNYPAFAAAPLALSLGAALPVLIGWLRPVAKRAVTAVIGVVLISSVLAQLKSSDGFSFPGTELSRILATRSGCVTTDHPISLILSDRLRADLRAGCRLVVDLSGYIHVLEGSSQRRDNPEFQAVLMAYLGSDHTAIVMSGMWPRDFSPDNRALVRAWPVVGSAGTIEIRQPTRSGP